MENFTFKDLQNVSLAAHSPITFGDRTYQPGEICVTFDKIQISNFKELKDWRSANGGFDNRAHVMWETDKGIAITFSQGVMNRTQFALMTGSKYRDYTNTNKTRNVKRFLVIDTASQYLDMLSSGEEWYINIPDTTEQKENFVVKDVFGNVILASFQETDKGLKVILPKTETTEYFPISVAYDDIVPTTATFTFGMPSGKTFYTLQGFTTFVDDKTGDKTLQLIEIPKLQITSELKMSVGAKANPVVGTFSALALPIGDRVHKSIMVMEEMPESVAFM